MLPATQLEACIPALGLICRHYLSAYWIEKLAESLSDTAEVSQPFYRRVL